MMNNDEIIEKLKVLKELLDSRDEKLPYEYRVNVARKTIDEIISSS